MSWGSTLACLALLALLWIQDDKIVAQREQLDRFSLQVCRHFELVHRAEPSAVEMLKLCREMRLRHHPSR